MKPPESCSQLVSAASSPLDGLPSVADLAKSTDLADTFSDLRAWIRRTTSQKGGLAAAAHLLSCEQRVAVLEFLEKLTSNPLRKSVAKELLAKLSSDEGWCRGVAKSYLVTEETPQKRPTATATGRAASVSGARMSADPIKHKLAQDFLDKLEASVPTCLLRLAGTTSHTQALRLQADWHKLARDSAPIDQFARATAPSVPKAYGPDGAALYATVGEAPVTAVFSVPRACHHVVVGKQGESIAKLQDEHSVEIRVPKLEEDCEAIAISGSAAAIEGCRRALEILLHLPVGTAPLHQMILAVPRSSYGCIIGERGAILHQLMQSCNVLIEIPKAEAPGNVTIHGSPDGCQSAKLKIEGIIRDTAPILSSSSGKSAVMPLPPSYDLTSGKPIQKCLFFPEDAALQSDDGLTSLGTLLKFLDSARVSCDACVFTITDNRIARRLLDAHRYRGVRVRVITDKAQSDALGSDIAEFQAAGIEVRMNTSPHHMHHKFCILDGSVLLNGSFNWTQGACENNCENVMISNDAAFLSPFMAQFERLWKEYSFA